MSAAGDSGYDVCPPGLVPLNDGASNGHSKPQVVQARSAGEVQARAAETAANGDGEHVAVMEIDLEWKEIRKVGSGLHNLGNTCFLNSVLQCLTHTAPLASLALSGGRYPGGSLHDLLSHVRKALSSSGGVLAPTQLIKGLRQTSKHFRHGRQEDAHEYARCLLEACQRHRGGNRVHQGEVNTKEVVSTIFGGRLCSQVKCLNGSCRYVSNTFDPFLDLSLEISRASTLTKALQRFTAVETLDGNNKYKCEECRALVKASKRFWIESAPNVLTVQLKRFEYGAYGRKVDKHVKFPSTLDLTPYMRAPACQPGEYSLYAVLVHSGHSTHSGHYYSFIKAPSGVWYLMDDSRVRQVGERHVLDQRAYMLFYVRKAPKAKRSREREQDSNAAVEDEPVARGRQRSASTCEAVEAVSPADAQVDESSEEEQLEEEEEEEEERMDAAGVEVVEGPKASRRASGPRERSALEALKDGTVSGGRNGRHHNVSQLRRMVTQFIRKMRALRRGHRLDQVMMSPIQKRRSMRIELRNLVLRRNDPLFIMGDGTRGVLSSRERLAFDDGAGRRRRVPKEGSPEDTEDGDGDVEMMNGIDAGIDGNPDEAPALSDPSRTADHRHQRASGSDKLMSMIASPGSDHGHTANVLNAGQWQDADERLKEKAMKLKRAGAPKIKKIDEWDEEYDRGKQRKVKKEISNPDDEEYKRAVKALKRSGSGSVQNAGVSNPFQEFVQGVSTGGGGTGRSSGRERSIRGRGNRGGRGGRGGSARSSRGGRGRPLDRKRRS